MGVRVTGRTRCGRRPHSNNCHQIEFREALGRGRLEQFASFKATLGLYGGSCWSWQPTPWGWQRVWVCDYDYGYYGYY
jgi:hypothetical protein